MIFGSLKETVTLNEGIMDTITGFFKSAPSGPRTEEEKKKLKVEIGRAKKIISQVMKAFPDKKFTAELAFANDADSIDTFLSDRKETEFWFMDQDFSHYYAPGKFDPSKNEILFYRVVPDFIKRCNDALSASRCPFTLAEGDGDAWYELSYILKYQGGLVK